MGASFEGERRGQTQRYTLVQEVIVVFHHHSFGGIDGGNRFANWSYPGPRRR